MTYVTVGSGWLHGGLDRVPADGARASCRSRHVAVNRVASPIRRILGFRSQSEAGVDRPFLVGVGRHEALFDEGHILLRHRTFQSFVHAGHTVSSSISSVSSPIRQGSGGRIFCGPFAPAAARRCGLGSGTVGGFARRGRPVRRASAGRCGCRPRAPGKLTSRQGADLLGQLLHHIPCVVGAVNRIFGVLLLQVGEFEAVKLRSPTARCWIASIGSAPLRLSSSTLVFDAGADRARLPSWRSWL